VDEATRLRTPALADCTDSQFPVSGFEQFGLGLRPPISKEPTFSDLPILAIKPEIGDSRLEPETGNRELRPEN
jgi:hypothetical protein